MTGKIAREIMAFGFIWFWVVRHSSFEAETLLTTYRLEALEKVFGGSSDPSTSAKVSVPSSILKMAKTTWPMPFVGGELSLMVACS
jgi:hypothetical protein